MSAKKNTIADVEGVTQMLQAKLSMNEQMVKNTLKNPALVNTIQLVLKHAEEVTNNWDKTTANLLYMVASRLPDGAESYIPMLSQFVASKKLKSVPQVEAALAFIKKAEEQGGKFDQAKFEQECGVGVEISQEQIVAAVDQYLNSIKEQLLVERYTTNVGVLMGKIKAANPEFKWLSDVAPLTAAIENARLNLLGPKTEQDEIQKNKPKAKAPAKAEKAKPQVEAKSDNNTAPAEKKGFFKEFAARDMKIARNSAELLQKHKEETGGINITRFPPEPNGYLHIGHAKSMYFNFGVAQETGGKCFLRFDDTNPEAEKLEYINSIEESVKWMGHTPCNITFSSDYFDKLYEFAIQLIKNGLAYVDFSTPDEIKNQRETRTESKWRNTPVDVNLKEFENMTKGVYEEGKAILRLKMDMKHDNPNMRDIIAYRIKYTPHPHVGDKWVIYPTYDYTHCIVDSLENITHSICTLEFENRRESYYWLLDALNIYKPYVWEFARLNITNTVLSKRKLNKLVTDKYVHGWDDPRILTLMGLRRRGYAPEAINNFCEEIGISRNENTINIGVLENNCRKYMDKECNRAFAILDPIKVVLENWEDDKILYVDAPNHPQNEQRGVRKLPFTKVFYIERSDFKEQDEKDFFGLAPGKEVGLRFAGCNLKCTSVLKDETGKITELRATCDFSQEKKKVKGHLHWVAQPKPGQDPLVAEVRLYDHLFTVPELGDDYLNYLNPNSEIIIPKAFVDPSLAGVKPFDRFQFERVGYFSVDPDSTPERLVFNRTVTLKESKLLKELK